MVVVRFVFQAKFGTAGQVVEGMKEDLERFKQVVGDDVKARLLTDLSGPFDTIVQEIEMESLAAWEELRAKMFASEEFQEGQETRSLPFQGGRAEFYTLEASY
jgi:hypothetical protein